MIDSRTEAFTFLRDEFLGASLWPSQKILKKVTQTLKRKTRRVDGRSLDGIILDASQTLRGWLHDFQHSTRKGHDKDLDGWLRMHLRSLIRKRQGGHGETRGFHANFTWPNRFFTDHGLFRLTTAHALACQSSRRYHHQPERGTARKVVGAGKPHAQFEGRRSRIHLALPHSSPLASIVD
ncbi:MAG: hypothetical protein KDA80_01495 [Planctomycetaceae bacterium]|nr:hypothetical protein [Planctomycetaceae bacterium]